MSKFKFTISFKQTQKDMQLYSVIKAIEEMDRSQKIKEILYKVLVEGKDYEK